MRLISGS
ncbi:hypothetical protein HID58_022470 [Brassica napus]|nr:hypothetical protein HID58_022470 [Brassica napus]